MKIELTNRAKEKGWLEVELLSMTETDHYIAGVLYEKRIKEEELIEWLDPIIIFKEPVKHGEYDKAVRLAEEAGIVFLLPESRNFKTDYYGLSFKGYKTLVKSWGYTSNHVPVSKRWKKTDMQEKANDWLPDIALMAEIIDFILQQLKLEQPKEEIIPSLQQLLKQKSISYS